MGVYDACFLCTRRDAAVQLAYNAPAYTSFEVLLIQKSVKLTVSGCVITCLLGIVHGLVEVYP